MQESPMCSRMPIRALAPAEFTEPSLLKKNNSCHAGVSRSAAIVTAYMMKTSGLKFQQAYQTLRTVKPDAEMIEEFVCQLKLYEAMGCEVSTTSAMYRQYRLQKVAMKYPELEDLLKVFADDPTSIPQGKHNEPIYRCRKCRRFLFRSFTILNHAFGSGQAAFIHKRTNLQTQLRETNEAKCTSYFIEPVQWMEPALLGVVDGQLLCPKCSYKLGTFNWHGEQCSCGRWVTPAFQIHKNRVDEVKSLPHPLDYRQ
ncbi:dual specificity protein phosphatase 12 isoform X4 [Pleurodeles waltl]|uniref:dual specificity protein phosphatase 12 isoform X4 n=1 Tax=Pleurodeles waltl TaxID=8319 RepID=UPI003709C307